MLATLNSIDGVYAIRTHGGSFQMKGTPDVLGCAYGRFFVIEAKRSHREKPSEAQQYVLKKFHEAGGKTFVSSDPRAQEVLDWISKLSR